MMVPIKLWDIKRRIEVWRVDGEDVVTGEEGVDVTSWEMMRLYACKR
jgi:hypothetical protein